MNQNVVHFIQIIFYICQQQLIRIMHAKEVFKLPQYDNNIKEEIIKIYGEKIYQATIKIFNTYKSNADKIRLLCLTATQNDHAQQLEIILEQHIAFIRLFITKLSFEQTHHRFLKIKITWTDTFTQDIVTSNQLIYQLICSLYNYVMLSIYNINRKILKRNYDIKRIETTILYFKELMTLIQKLKTKQKGLKFADLCDQNILVLQNIMIGLYKIIKHRLEQNQPAYTKLLPQNKAKKYYEIYKTYQKVYKALRLQKFPQKIIHFYKKIITYQMILNQIQYCFKMIRHFQLYLFDKPSHFKDMLGFSKKLLNCVNLKDCDKSVLEKFEISDIYGFKLQAQKIQDTLNYKNKEIYNMKSTEVELLPEIQYDLIKINQIEIKGQNKVVLDQELFITFKQFWDRKYDDMSLKLEKTADNMIQQIKNEILKTEIQVNKITKNQKLNQQKQIIKKLTILKKEKEAILNLNIKTLENSYGQAIQRLTKIINESKDKHVKQWAEQNFKKVKNTVNINNKIKEFVNKNGQKLSQIIQFQPSITLIKNKYEGFIEKIKELEELKYKPYLKMLLKYKEQQRQYYYQKLTNNLIKLKNEWLNQILKFQQKCKKYEQKNLEIQLQLINQFIKIKQNQQFGIEFYKKLIEEIQKVIVKLNQTKQPANK